MNYTDNELQAAIDAAMLELETGNQLPSLDTWRSSSWNKESQVRLALAKAFLAKLPEPYPSKGETCSVCNWTNTSLFNLGEPDVPRWVCVGCCKRMFDRQPILADDGRLEKELAHQTDMGCQAAVCGPKVALDEAIRRMESVTKAEIWKIYMDDSNPSVPEGLEAVRAHLIAAARGDVEQQSEAELAAIKSSQLGILRPINEAGPIPDGCVRVKGYRCTENAWALAHWENRHDTHFADIRIPEPETLKKTTKEIPNDQILQQAIDESCQEIRPKVQGSLVLAPDAPLSWPAEANARLTLAKLFLSKLP